MSEDTVTGQEKIASETMMTPEEKLFRLIASANQNDAELQELLKRYAPSPRKGTPRGILRPVADLGAGVAEAGDILRFRIKKMMAQPWISLPVLRLILYVSIGAVCFYFLSGLETGRMFYISPESRFGEVGIQQATSFFPRFFQKDFWYSASVPSPEVELPVSATAVPAVTVLVPAKDGDPFKLVGISSDDAGRVAMVEPPRDPHARFVRQGDLLPGGVKVMEVKEYSVVLAAGKRIWEIS